MSVAIVHANALHIPLTDESVHTTITSPPYWGLRDYGLPPTLWPEITYTPMAGLPPVTIPAMECCLGLEDTPEAYVGHLVAIFREVWRTLRDDGTAWVNLGDSYASSGVYHDSAFAEMGANLAAAGMRWSATGNGGRGRAPTPVALKPKDLCGIPWRVALALQADGWWLRSDAPWIRKNCMPESVQDRPTKGHEYVFLLAKSERYFFDAEAVREPLTEWSQKALEGRWRRRERNKPSEREAGDKNLSAGAHYGAAINPAGRNRRTTDWWFESLDAEIAHLEYIREHGGMLFDGDMPIALQVNTKPYSGAHFAVFNDDLIRPMILSSTSERGCCSACGAPWERLVERDSQEHPPQPQDHLPEPERRRNGTRGNRLANVGQYVGESTTTGWRPTCDCDADVVPCVVLDPFAGSGTTGMVALEHSRHAVLLDLSPDYLSELAKERTAAVQPVLQML